MAATDEFGTIHHYSNQLNKSEAFSLCSLDRKLKEIV